MKHSLHTISGVLAIVGLAYLAGIGQSFFRAQPVILGGDERDGAAAPSAAGGDGPKSEFERILDAPVPDGMLTLRQAHQRWIDGAYFIDARHKHEYDLGHISGAAHLNAETFFTDEGRAEMQTIPPDAQVVVYCVGGLCDASENTKALLAQMGYSDLSVMGVGYDDWVSVGFPVSRTDQSGESP